MALLVTVFLMEINLGSHHYSGAPSVQGLTAADVWILVCILFVSTALVEFAVLMKMFLPRSGEKNDGQTGSSSSSSSSSYPSCLRKKEKRRRVAATFGDVADADADADGDVAGDVAGPRSALAVSIDRWSLRIFPVPFAAFVLAYVAVYMPRAE